MSKKYEELNEAKKKRFEGRIIEQIQVDIKYENYHVNEIMDLILPDDTPRYAIKTKPEPNLINCFKKGLYLRVPFFHSDLR